MWSMLSEGKKLLFSLGWKSTAARITRNVIYHFLAKPPIRKLLVLNVNEPTLFWKIDNKYLSLWMIPGKHFCSTTMKG